MYNNLDLLCISSNVINLNAIYIISLKLLHNVDTQQKLMSVNFWHYWVFINFGYMAEVKARWLLTLLSICTIWIYGIQLLTVLLFHYSTLLHSNMFVSISATSMLSRLTCFVNCSARLILLPELHPICAVQGNHSIDFVQDPMVFPAISHIQSGCLCPPPFLLKPTCSAFSCSCSLTSTDVTDTTSICSLTL